MSEIQSYDQQCASINFKITGLKKQLVDIPIQNMTFTPLLIGLESSVGRFNPLTMLKEIESLYSPQDSEYARMFKRVFRAC